MRSDGRARTRGAERAGADGRRRERVPPGRGQLSTSTLEALLGALLLASVAAGFVVGDAGPDAEPRLDAYAADATTLLAADAPTAANASSRLDALTRSPEAYETTRGPTHDRLVDALPASVFVHVDTPHGSVGRPPPARPTGRARAATPNGTVVVETWYA